MILNVSSEKVENCLEIHCLSNGGCALIDANNRLIAYKKRDFKAGSKGEDWDWVRKDCRKDS